MQSFPNWTLSIAFSNEHATKAIPMVMSKNDKGIQIKLDAIK